MKTRTVGVMTGFILVTIALLLATGSGYFLYSPARFNLFNPFGILNIIGGNVQVLAKDSLSWKKAGNGMTLEPGSRIKTSGDSRATITFVTGTTSTLEAGTDLIIDKLDKSGGSSAYAVILKQQSGQTWNQVDKAGGKADFRIRTDTSEITVHGTLFSTQVDAAGTTTVQTTEGKVSVSAAGAEVQVPAGMMTSVEPGRQPSAVAAIPQAGKELVITLNQSAIGTVKDPSGQSVGYLEDGTKLNQIPGSSISADQSVQTIRIPNPQAGDYSVMLRGAADADALVSVEGLVDGKSAFLHVESCNLTAARDMVLNLQYNVIEAVFHPAGDQPAGGALAAASLPVGTVSRVSKSLDTTAVNNNAANLHQPLSDAYLSTAAGNKNTIGQGADWLGTDESSRLGRLATAACFLFFIAVVFIIMRRKN